MQMTEGRQRAIQIQWGTLVVPLHFLGSKEMINSSSNFWLAEPVYTSYDYEI